MQTRKTRRIPIVLVGRKFWQGLIAWFKDVLVAEGMISESDLDLYEMADTPQEVIDIIFAYYEKRGFEPSAEEKEILLDL